MRWSCYAQRLQVCTCCAWPQTWCLTRGRIPLPLTQKNIVKDNCSRLRIDQTFSAFWFPPSPSRSYPVAFRVEKNYKPTFPLSWSDVLKLVTSRQRETNLQCSVDKNCWHLFRFPRSKNTCQESCLYILSTDRKIARRLVTYVLLSRKIHVNTSFCI